MGKFDKKLHSMLVKNEVVRSEQADEALELSTKNGKGFIEILIEKQYAHEGDVIGCISHESGLPPVDLKKVTVTPDIMEYLPQDLASYYGVVPLSRIGKILTVAVANPFDVVKLDDVEIVTGCDLRPVVSTEGAIRSAIERFYSPGEKVVENILDQAGEIDLELTEARPEEEEDLSDLISGNEASPVVKLVNLIIYQAVRERASDIHIEPYEKKLRIRYRQDGTLREVLSPPKRMQNAVSSRIKIMSDLDIAERRKPQDGKFQIKMDGRQVDFRVSILPVVHGEKIVLRLLDSGNISLGLDQLGFEEKCLTDFKEAIGRPYGMVLVTGPTGSGKSTTLYSAVREVMNDTENLVTVEDPVEYQIEGINQVPVNPKRGLTFSAALRSILRQDPDTVMIGEIRDAETIEIAIKAALTGHLVFSTLHTNDAASTITRMVDMGVDPFLVASATNLVSAQRLLKKLCPACKESYEAPLERFLAIGYSKEEAKQATLFRAKGCAKCSGGYKGRFALLETLPVTDSVKRLIIQGKSALDIKELALEEGMLTLRRCALLNALRGKTSIEEVLSMTMPDK
jgi:type IV pilus assembly protein PilB